MAAFGRGCRPKRMPGLRLIGSFKIAECSCSESGRSFCFSPIRGSCCALSDLLTALRHAAMKARDVGEDFPKTVRAMASGAAACESVRGKCTPREEAELRAEGIDVLALPKDWFEPMN